MPTAPAASRANKKAHEQVTTGLASNAGFPRANGFNGFLRALPGDRLFDSHILEPQSGAIFNAAEGFEA
jgi:hypothetical protein